MTAEQRALVPVATVILGALLHHARLIPFSDGATVSNPLIVRRAVLLARQLLTEIEKEVK